MSELQVEIGPRIFAARLERELAPAACSAFEALLPFEGPLIHARWSGEACWVPMGQGCSDMAPENATCFPAPGQCLLYQGPISEMELLIPYGPTSFACKAGPLAGSHFLTIDDRAADLAGLGREILWGGARRLRIDRLAYRPA